MLLIVWSQEAENDLIEIISFIGERNPIAAEKLGKSIKDSALPLSEHPMVFKQSDRMPGCREIVVSPNYIVVYQIGIDHIEVLRVLHARQEYPMQH